MKVKCCRICMHFDMTTRDMLIRNPRTNQPLYYVLNVCRSCMPMDVDQR
jgi:hypothetical protein